MEVLPFNRGTHAQCSAICHAIYVISTPRHWFFEHPLHGDYVHESHDQGTQASLRIYIAAVAAILIHPFHLRLTSQLDSTSNLTSSREVRSEVADTACEPYALPNEAVDISSQAPQGAFSAPSGARIRARLHEALTCPSSLCAEHTSEQEWHLRLS